MRNREPILTVENLSVTFEEERVICDLSFQVEEGEVLAVIGPNGSGKTTLFRAILGLVEYNGEIHIKYPRKDIGYVPQRLAVDRDLPLSAEEFFYLREMDSSEISSVLNLTRFPKKLLKRKIGLLSGGEFQRLLISWALLGNPKLLLFDEPTAWVDITAEETIFQILHTLKKERSLTILLISHDLNVVYKEASRVLCLNKKMICHGSPREALTSKALERLYGGGQMFYQHGKHA